MRRGDELVGRLLQGARAAAAAVLHDELEAAGGAEPLHRRRRMTKMSASGIVAEALAAASPSSSSAVGPCSMRSSNGFGPTKIAPAFGLLARVAPEKPANADGVAARPASPG